MGSSNPEAPEAALARADAALHEAKNSGRDRACLSATA
jgi:PleD family two-component response regulator